MATPDESPAPRARGRYAKGEARREQILDKALEVFGELGFAGASIREIAQRCGVTHQSLMHYFATKDELLMAVLHRRDDRLASHFGEERGVRVADLVALAEDNTARPGHVAMFNTAAADASAPAHPAHDYYARFYHDLIEALERAIRAESAIPLAEGMNARDAARIMLAIQDGLQLQWLYDPDDVDVPGLMRAARAVLGVPFGTPNPYVNDK